jgi:single-stranded-DNA-specific exonuclease
VTLRYSITEPNLARADQVAASFGVPHLAAVLIAARGHDDAFVGRLLNPDRLPSSSAFPDLSRAADLVRKHLSSRVVVYGDYDADGVCSVSILHHALLSLGNRPVVHVPHRTRDGYGLNVRSLRRLLSAPTGLLITADCGITSAREVVMARECGAEVLVIDHHTPPSSLPPFTQCLHPAVHGWPDPHPCAAGVCLALALTLLPSPPADLLTLACFATVADVVDLLGANRRIVSTALADLPISLPGLLAICEDAGIPATARDVAFNIAPRLNAAGRLGCASIAVELFTTQSYARARQIAAHMSALNAARKVVQSSICDGLPSSSSPVAVSSPDWHPGVVGIAAGKLAERLGVPVAVGHTNPDGRVTGSVRSPSTSVHDILSSCSHHLSSWGGHAAAGGFSSPSFSDFAASFAASPAPSPRREPAPHVRLPSLTIESVTGLSALEPYGAGNREPVFASRSLILTGTPRVIGKDRTHLSLEFAQGPCRLRAVAFGMANRLAELHPGRFYNVAYVPAVNHWNGKTTVQIQVRDFEESFDRV